MTRTKLLSILQEETDGFKNISRLRDDVLDAMETAYVKGKREQLSIPVVVEPKGKLEMFQNMQYYMEHCQRNGYITPQDWLEKEKHF